MQKLNTFNTYLTHALLMTAQAWRANKNNTTAAQHVQKLYMCNLKCLMSLNHAKDNIQSIATKALQLASLLPPDDIPGIEKCYFYAEQLVHTTTSQSKDIKPGF